MDCTVASDARFARNKGRPSSHLLTYDGFWRRYLSTFDSVKVLGRLDAVENSIASPVEGSGVKFEPLPNYTGPIQFLMNIGRLKKSVREVCCDKSAFILRLPGAVGWLVWRELLRTGRPYAVEVVGDPYDVFEPGAVRHPLRPFFRWWFTRQLRQQCTRACAVAYVTEGALQRRYPPAPDAFTTHYSSVNLRDEAFVSSPRSGRQGRGVFRVVTVGSLAQLYKAPDVLIDAVATCVREDMNVELVLIGDGKHRSELEARVEALGIGRNVRFAGQLPSGESVRAHLDQADLFVLPSRQEGLPRAMIEAMAQALPCIGSTVGGIPELLPLEDTVPSGDAVALAQKVREIAYDPERMARMSARNLEKAKEYHGEILQERRIAFYQRVKEKTEVWLRTRH